VGAQTILSLQTALILILAGIGVVDTLLGGLRGNARANVAQNIIAGSALIALCGYVGYYHFGGAAPPPFFEAQSLRRLVPELGVVGLVTNVVFSLAWQFVDMSAWQNLAAVRRIKQAHNTEKTLWWSSLLVFVFPGLVGTVLGMYLRGISNLTSDNIVQQVVILVAAHPWFSIVVMAGFISAMLSTIDGLLLAGAQAATWDIFRRSTVAKLLATREPHAASVGVGDVGTGRTAEYPIEEMQPSEQQVLDETRWWIVGLALAGGGITLALTRFFNVSIFDLVYIIVVAQMILFPVILCVLFSDGKKQFGTASVASGLLIGIATVVLCLALRKQDLLPWAPVVALVLSSVFAIFGSLTRKKNIIGAIVQ